MQIKLFYVPVGDEPALAELNAFLRGQRVLGVTEQYDAGLGCWAYARLGRAATPAALITIPGIGKGKAEKYGPDLLNKTNAQ